MTMPGFVFHFRCDSCDASSHDYSVFAFSDVLRPDVVLPAWSLRHRCWATGRTRQERPTAAEFRAAPLSLIDLSVRARMIARDLNIGTVGELEAARSRFDGHPSATETAIAEIEDLLSRKPGGGS